ncbi:MAG TPA: GAF domain-containing protein [Usitatibacter sp.]|jgi:PAS domain S-box-containing protein|nr:GAF domain-containing protein [Usitatibacter sp.]
MESRPVLDAFRNSPAAPSPEFLTGGGDMGERMRAHDWSRTPLGPAREWPQALRAAVRIMLASRQAVSIWWGPALVNLYNDACRPLAGANHPAALGQAAPSAWREIWDDIGARVEGALRGAEPGTQPAVPLLVERHGRVEEAHYTLSFAALPADDGSMGGVLCTFADVTQGVVWDRQMNVLRHVSLHAAAATSVHEACVRAVEALAWGAADVPFAAIYFADVGLGQASLAAAAGIPRGHPALPETLPLDTESPWRVQDALVAAPTGHPRVTLGDALLGTLPTGRWSMPPREAVVTRLACPAIDGRVGVLIAALNPFRMVSDDHRRFVELAAAQVAAAVANVQARREEARRLEAETLQAVARDIASELDLRQLMQKVTDAATRLTGARFGAFFHNVKAGDGDAYQVYTLSGAPREAFEEFGMPRATPVFKPTFDGEAPVRVADIRKDPRYGRWGPHHGMPKGHLPVTSYLAVPVISRSGEVHGGLFFAHPGPGVFDERAERNAVAIAAQAAVAIDNANLFGRAHDEIGRRAKLERDLRESEQGSRSLVENLPAAVYTTDADGRIAHFNQAAAELWGRAPALGIDRFGGSAALFTPGGERIARAASPLARTLKGEDVGHSVEIITQRPDGVLRHVLAHPRALRDDAGRIVGGLNMLVDITQRKAAEAELAFTKDQLSLQVQTLTRLHQLAMDLGGAADLSSALHRILETSVETQEADFGLVWVHDAATGRLVVQASCGFDAEARALFHDVEAGPYGGSAGNAFASGSRWIIEDIETDPAFEPFLASARKVGFRAVHSTPIVTRAGALLGVISIHYRLPREPLQREMQAADVCARHAADAIEASRNQEALRESERIYRAMGESIDYGVWLCDAKGGAVYQSESFLRLTGATQEEQRGAGWRAIMHPEDLPRVTAEWSAAVREGRQFDCEYRVRRASGGWQPILGRGVPVRNDRGAIEAWAGINLDIGRLKHVENELRELDQRKNEFLATLAHELRNPLAPLRNGLEVMRLAASDADTLDKARSMMERQLRQMVRLVDDLLDVSRVSRGKIELKREDIQLAAVLRNALETSAPLMAERRHELVTRIPDTPVLVHGDLTRLSQVFWNLLNNAAKYTEPGGRIELEVEPGKGAVVVTVRDSGIGIPAAMLARVFDIFTQVDRSLEKSQGGLGIGLSIAKRLVEMHGGSIHARSDGNGRGSAFIVQLPARVGSRPAAANEETFTAAPPVRHRILVADDNLDSVTTLSLMLEVLGNEVFVAHDGAEAVDLARRHRPQAILLDIGMPRMNGYDACARIREEAWGREPLIVALTGWGQEEDKSRSRDAGFDRHLVKPVEPAMLEKLIGALPPS